MTNKRAGAIMKRLLNTHIVGKRPEKQAVDFRVWCQFEYGYLEVICDRCHHKVTSVNLSEQQDFLKRGYALAPLVEILASASLPRTIPAMREVEKDSRSAPNSR